MILRNKSNTMLCVKVQIVSVKVNQRNTQPVSIDE